MLKRSTFVAGATQAPATRRNNESLCRTSEWLEPCENDGYDSRNLLANVIQLNVGRRVCGCGYDHAVTKELRLFLVRPLPRRRHRLNLYVRKILTQLRSKCFGFRLANEPSTQLMARDVIPLKDLRIDDCEPGDA